MDSFLKDLIAFLFKIVYNSSSVLVNIRIFARKKLNSDYYEIQSMILPGHCGKVDEYQLQHLGYTCIPLLFPFQQSF